MYLLTLLQFTSCSERGELTILTTKHGLLSSYTLRKVCFLTTNEFNWRATTQKVYFLTTDLRVIMVTCWATRNICFVTTTHHWASKHSFQFLSDAGLLVTWCRRLAGQNTCSIAEVITRLWWNLPLVWEGRIGEEIRPNPDWTMIVLHFVNLATH